MLSSCKKTSNVEVTVSTSGKLSYQLVDDASKGIPNVSVNLYEVNPGNYDILLDTRLTNNDGVADFGDLNPSTYLITAPSVSVKDITYSFKEYVQVLTGKTNHKTLRVTDYVGTMQVVLRSYSGLLVVKNIGVLVIPESRYDANLNVSGLLTLSEAKGVTDEKGICSFKVAADISYFVVTYNLETKQKIGYDMVSQVARGATELLTQYLYDYN